MDSAAFKNIYLPQNGDGTYSLITTVFEYRTALDNLLRELDTSSIVPSGVIRTFFYGLLEHMRNKRCASDFVVHIPRIISIMVKYDQFEIPLVETLSDLVLSYKDDLACSEMLRFGIDRSLNTVELFNKLPRVYEHNKRTLEYRLSKYDVNKMARLRIQVIAPIAYKAMLGEYTLESVGGMLRTKSGSAFGDLKEHKRWKELKLSSVCMIGSNICYDTIKKVLLKKVIIPASMKQSKSSLRRLYSLQRKTRWGGGYECPYKKVKK